VALRLRPAGQKEASGAAQPRTALLAAGTLAAYAVSALSLATAPALPASASLEAQAAALANVLQDEVEAALVLAAPFRARLRGTEPVDWKSFEADFAEGRARRPSQELLLWAPTVSAAQRLAFEADSGREAFRSWNIVALNEHGVPFPAPARPVHHPIALTAPAGPGADLLGLDFGSLPEVEAALGRRRGPGPAPSVVGPISLLPQAACTTWRPACAQHILLLIPTTDESSSLTAAPGPRHGSPRLSGTLVVALSWSAITDAARASAATAAGRPTPGLQWSRSRTARATFQVQDESWAIDLLSPPGGTLSARLGHAAPSRGN
jgi:hypothetical protein